MRSDTERAWHAMLKAQSSVTRALEQALTDEKLPLSWYGVLVELDTSAIVSMSQLGSRVVLSRAQISRVVKDMKAAGLVDQEVSSEDRRVQFASLTPQGRERLQRAAPIFQSAIDDALGRAFDPAEVRRLEERFNAVIERLPEAEN